VVLGTKPEAGGDESEYLDVVGVGSPLVDVLSTTEDSRLVELGLEKGSMTLVDLEAAERLYGAMGPAVEVSGGSAANTMAGIAALGGSAGFVGKVADDPLGEVFIHDIRAAGVAYHPVLDPQLAISARPLPRVRDGRRRAHHGHPSRGGDHHHARRPPRLAGGAWLAPLPRGLPLGPPTGKGRHAPRHRGEPRERRCRRPQPLDSFCVERHRREFLDLLTGEIDVLFANEDEIVALFGASSFEAALDDVEETGVLAALTRGAGGSVVVTPNGVVHVGATPVERVVDTTGAGDLFAAGFLYGLTHGMEPEACAHSGASAPPR